MGNTHGVADMAKELQATTQDLLPACIVSTTFPAIPAPPSLTLAAFATKGYVRDGIDLVYVEQEAHTVVLTGGDGQYWLALGQDTWTTVASWNRTAGTHYLWRASATQPPAVDGILTFIQMTVAGGAITVVTPLTSVTSTPLSKQLSGAVAITGGTATFSGAVTVNGSSVTTSDGYYVTNAAPGAVTGFSSVINAGASRYALYFGGTAPSYVGGTVQVADAVGIRQAPNGAIGLSVTYNKSTQYGIVLTPFGSDTGTQAMLFKNIAGTDVGSISTSATATAFNTSSDVRLKHSIAPLTAALERVRALRPVSFRWNSTDEQDEGFLAHELMQVAPGAVTGLPDEVHADGSIKPQQVDASKILPLLTAGLQAALAQIDALTARMATLEAALGA
jgi:Chaperone of endosialidase